MMLKATILEVTKSPAIFQIQHWLLSRTTTAYAAAFFIWASSLFMERALSTRTWLDFLSTSQDK